MGQRLNWQKLTGVSGKFPPLISEIYALNNFIEQNDWHNDTPWAQALRLMQWVTELPESLGATVSIPEQPLVSLLALTLDPTNGSYSLHQLLSFASLIHDVGKAKTFRPQPDGTSRCPGHEAVGAQMTQGICQRFDFTAVETNFITSLVAHHGEPYALFKQIRDLPLEKQEAAANQFEAQHAPYLQPLLLLAYGDMITSHLQTINLSKFTAVSRFYRSWLQKVFLHE